MSEDRKAAPIARRQFLKTAGLGAGAAGVAATALAVKAPEADAAAAPAGKPRAGYRETDHVRRYYELAKF
ncbi:MAG: twin-arginine translocation signal domain-containing protein [Hyphomicrobiales bacterium]|nr:twin-arginine translocation signal domain-containing protein [Hyphomicrobiales bacterium]MCP5371814.1 twin-arginine translocation signal domain-containing protein [Hyphomicrobiales bacterium]